MNRFVVGSEVFGTGRAAGTLQAMARPTFLFSLKCQQMRIGKTGQTLDERDALRSQIESRPREARPEDSSIYIYIYIYIYKCLP